MTFSFMLIHEVTIVKPAIVISRAGDEVRDWENATRTASKCWLNSQRVAEGGGLEADRSIEAEFFFDSLDDIEYEDRLECLDRTYSVTGPPKPRYTVRGLHHYEVQAKSRS